MLMRNIFLNSQRAAFTKVLRICGQAAHLFGQSLDNLRMTDSRKSSLMLPNDFLKAIGFYKEALAILRNSALWRYNIPFTIFLSLVESAK
jgi:hypothetical protein